MSKKSKVYSLFLPFIIGIVLGITAKLIDVPYVTSKFPIFDHIMGRFGIWVWTAAIISVFSKTALFAVVRSFVFFIGMLFAYYGLYGSFFGFLPEITNNFVGSYRYDYSAVWFSDMADT